MRLAVMLMISALAVACAQPQRERPDGPPPALPDPDLIEWPLPHPEPRSAYGNHTPYEVMGQTYRVLDQAAGYSEEGIASWYGTKFHGRMTSSGEPYDMYQLTAAHRTLPLPTWAEVTHLDTGRRIIVRVNDRGPFHADRLIDLSWAAAHALGMTEAGTAPVAVRAITFDEQVEPTPRPARLPVWVQVGAFAEAERAAAVTRELERAGIGPIATEASGSPGEALWRVRIGPVEELRRAVALLERVAELGLGPARYVYP
ncbi:MAG: septal ring lytic transglycosylase RlpA family protein [Pseudomonadota bacterium]|nr:MAG: septal ring lytic transglycosylase RlpA family protein [Pseudomonadota bacterium]